VRSPPPEGDAFLHALAPGHNSRVVALYRNAPDFNGAQEWTVTDRGDGRFTFHLDVGGSEHYLTAEADGHYVFTQPQDPNFNRQTWRRDQGAPGTIALGTSGRFLQGDRDILIVSENPSVDPNAVLGLNVELRREGTFGWREIT
jgi:hypothetical protein